MSESRNVHQYNQLVNEMTRMMLENIINDMTRSEDSPSSNEEESVNRTTNTNEFSRENNADTSANPIMNLLISGLDTIFTSTRQRFLDELDDIITDYVSDMSLRESQEVIHEEARVDVDLPFTIYENIEDKIEDKCAICLEIFEPDSKVCLLNCKHIFHKECIKGWINIKNTCPTCRVTI